ncbi:hypothetical protein G6F56_012568 [Rhizopus delemar]|nr:hypothetical protein G6F56_012568 [Rhizopus delemar]
MDENYYAPPSAQGYSPDEKSLPENNMLSWPPQNQPSNFLSMLTPSELEMTNLVDNSLWSMPGSSSNASFPLEPLGQVFWMPQVKQEWPQYSTLPDKPPLFPPTPPETAPVFSNDDSFRKSSCSRQLTPPATPYSHPFNYKRTMRRKSDEPLKATTRTYRRRASSHPSVASIVSLSAHEPMTRYIEGIEHITFLYSHERQVKEYTVRTDVASVQLDDISLDFRAQNSLSRLTATC